MNTANADRRINAPSPVLHPLLDEFCMVNSPELLSPELLPSFVDEISFVVSSSDSDDLAKKFTLAVCP